MKIIADLHLHSKYSRAVSQRMEPKTMIEWAKKKGIDLLGTADWTHPLWLTELEANLEEIGQGIYIIKGSRLMTKSASVFESRTKQSNSPSSLSRDAVNTKTLPNLSSSREPCFILSTEISSIYSQGGKSHRIHNVVLAPSFNTVHKVNDELKRRGCNLLSDGRPIIGLSSISLCELLWSIDENIIVIPAHVWTPWFSLYGSKSGFDSIDECYGEFAKNIFAVETGLSSDPAMNWRIKELDTRTIVSNSDSHSPQKMGREATVFELEELNFKSIASALRSATNLTRFANRTRVKSANQSSHSRDAVNAQTLSNLLPHFTPQQINNRILYTIEFHPEEGKYHYTGHRNCGIVQAPEETRTKGTTCPVCGKPLTVGVMHRVDEVSKGNTVSLTKKENEVGLVGYYNADNPKRPPYVMLVPLIEILAESLNTGVASIKVVFEYENIIKKLGSEIKILTQIKIEDIKKTCGERIAQGILKVRKGDMVVDPGYDGNFGVVKIWGNNKDSPAFAKASAGKEEQMSLL